ncbi:amino acid/amide ABC transporter substrate-binding protein, HAAT family [Faunimonas pinastri]|uniref:Amino acid/amide ABC transporter substrate-binding protein, HAAT family n=1 Tax=Faunimonas pinastri TaxID=1855383 RepID=A0A1H9GYB8_9HYPH|nr:amino acid/amide ABC transporter substrate-binding protein, HAAT family [Faunimonas pinastri]
MTLAAALLLAACTQSRPTPPPVAALPTTVAPTASAGADVARETLGSGDVHVAMLLPKRGSGNAAATGTAFRNAADLAMRDFPNSGIQLTIYDDGGTALGASAAMDAALADHSGIVLGPVFGASVPTVAAKARTAGVPVVAFSSDASVAGQGVYLLSFLPSEDIRRIVTYAASQGKKSFAALLPSSAYGSVVEAALRQTAGNVGARVIAIDHYSPDGSDLQAKAQAMAAQASQYDALLIPDSGDFAPRIASVLANAGVRPGQVQLLGSGQWDDPRVLSNAALAGAWYPAPTKQGFETFASKYQAAFGSQPPRNATLAYDGTVLAAGLVRRFGPDHFDSTTLTNPNGFVGVDGVFRFVNGGTTERALAIYQVTGTGSQVVSPAARGFGGNS